MDWSQISLKKIRGLIVFTILILVGLWKYEIVLDAVGFLWSIVFPFALGGAIAFIINVPMSFIEKKLFGAEKEERGKAAKKLARPVSLVLTIALVVSVLVLVLFVLVPQLGETFSALGQSISEFIPQMQNWMKDFTHNNSAVMEWVNSLEFKPDKMIQWGVDFLGSGAGSVMNTTVAAVGNIITGVTAFFIAFSFACYILIQKEKLHVQVRKVFFAFIPRRKAEVVLEVFSLTYKTFSNFLAGQCLEAVILGSMFVVSMSILKMPYALLIGVVISVTALIPIFGGLIGSTLGFIMIFMVSPKQAIFFVALFVILQQIEGNLIYPHVVGNSVGLPSIWVLAAVSIGGKMMGIVGMLIFIPLVSVVYALFREVVYLNLKKRKIKTVTAKDVEEYSPEEVEKMAEMFRKEHPELVEEASAECGTMAADAKCGVEEAAGEEDAPADGF